MPLPALAAVAKAAAPMLKKAALKAAKKKAVSTAMKAVRPKEEEQESMKKEYNKGGRKPGAAQDKVAKALSNRSSNQKFKSEINKLRSDRMSDKASTTKNKVVKKLREEVATKRADQARGNEAKAERSAKASSFASKRGDMARNRSKNKSAKAEIRAKYENGGRKKSDPVKEARKKIDAANAADKSTAGKARQSSLKSKNPQNAQSIIERGGVSNKNAKRVADRGAAPQTMIPKGALNAGTRMAKDFRERDPKTGMSPKSSRYQVSTDAKDKSLKGRTSGKSGNVGKGVQVKKNRLR